MSDVQKTLIFISHKHCDREIADVIRGFIRNHTSGHIDVYQSSSPFGEGPQAGCILNRELIDKLWRSSVLLLLYTDADKDWSYCMWEAGVATKPESPNTNIIVLQCGNNRPQVFQDRLSINLRKFDEVQRFVNDFLTDRQFVPRLNAPTTGFTSNSDDVTRIAKNFFQDLAAILPPEEEITEEWPACPFIQLRMDLTECDPSLFRKLSEEERAKHVRNHCYIVDADRYCEQLFGYPRFPPRMALSELVRECEERHQDMAWVNALSVQIAAAAMWQFPKPTWKYMLGDDKYFYAPVLTRVRRMPVKKSMEFDVYFNKFDISPESKAILHSGVQEALQLVQMRH